jgi:hypothetical protein
MKRITFGRIETNCTAIATDFYITPTQIRFYELRLGLKESFLGTTISKRTTVKDNHLFQISKPNLFLDLSMLTEEFELLLAYQLRT